MPINRTGLPHAAASTSRIDETPTTSRAPARRPLPDAQPSQNKRAAVFDGLSAMPPELRQQVVSRLSTRSMARLGATSRQMAADVREGMQTFLTEHPHYDPVADVGYVDSAARLRVALRMIRNLPYRNNEDRGARLSAYATYVERLPMLPAAERADAIAALAEHVGHLTDPAALPVLENLACDVRLVPEGRRDPALRTVLQTPLAAHEQVATDVLMHAEQAGVEALPPQARLLALALRGLPRMDCANVVNEVAAQLPGPPERAQALIYHQALVGLPDQAFRRSYERAAKYIARLPNGAQVMRHLADVSTILPDRQKRSAINWMLMHACSEVSNKDARTEMLLRLVSALPQQPVAIMSAQGLLMQAGLLGGERAKAVIAAIHENAETITPDFVELRAKCDQMTNTINARNAED